MENDIKRHEGDNLGGVNSIRFLPIEGISAVPLSYKGAIHHAVEVAPNYRWYDCYCTEFSMVFKEEQTDGEHGAAWKRTFTGKVPKDRQELSDILETMKNRRYILDITYNNGTRKLVGTIEEPMYFKSKLDSKAEITGRNEHEIVFEGEGLKKSPFYNV